MSEGEAVAEGEHIVSEWDRHSANIAHSIEAIAAEFRALARMFPGSGGEEVSGPQALSRRAVPR